MVKVLKDDLIEIVSRTPIGRTLDMVELSHLSGRLYATRLSERFQGTSETSCVAMGGELPPTVSVSANSLLTALATGPDMVDLRMTSAGQLELWGTVRLSTFAEFRPSASLPTPSSRPVTFTKQQDEVLRWCASLPQGASEASLQSGDGWPTALAHGNGAICWHHRGHWVRYASASCGENEVDYTVPRNWLGRGARYSFLSKAIGVHGEEGNIQWAQYLRAPEATRPADQMSNSFQLMLRQSLSQPPIVFDEESTHQVKAACRIASSRDAAVGLSFGNSGGSVTVQSDLVSATYRLAALRGYAGEMFFNPSYLADSIEPGASLRIVSGLAVIEGPDGARWTSIGGRKR